jgi:DNA-binding MarR family transcriptional regulator
MSLSKPSFRNYMNMRLEQVARTGRDAADKIYRRECGINIQTIRVLRIVSENPGLAVNQVKREANLDRTLVSRIVSDLVKRKLLARAISPDDARHFLLSTTPDGERLVKQANVLGDALNRDFLGVLDLAELEVFDRCLTKLLQWRPADP